MDKKTVKDLLEKYEEAFIEELENHATAYKLVGMGIHESPMWFQYIGIKNLSLTFKSSNNHRLEFSIPLDDLDCDLVTYSQSDWIYEHFRAVKYTYLKENHPTVYSEIK